MKKQLFVGILLPSFLTACAGPSRHPSLLKEPAQGIYHEVQKGETLWRIAQSYHVSVDDVASVNKLSDPSQLSPGQLLFIPGSSTMEGPSHASLPTHVGRGTVTGSASSHLNWPTRGRVLYHFGQGTPLGKNRGIDIAATEGSPVLAAASGTVAFAGEKLKGFGKTVILDHGRGLQTVYAHNEELLVKTGDVVKKLQPIARVGRTGRVERSTLHFEILRGNHPVNPMDYLSR